MRNISGINTGKRNLLKLAASASVVSAASTVLSQDGVADSQRSYDVIVVGAGMAGLAAAKELIQQGYEVLILEATERHGGRVYSASLGDTRIDLGAEEHYLGQNNPVYQPIIKEFGKDAYVEAYTGDQLLTMDGNKTCWESSGSCSSDDDIKDFWKYWSHFENRQKHKDFSVSMAEDIWDHYQVDKNHRAYHLYENAIAGSIYGTSLDKIGIASLNRQDWNWTLSESIRVLGSKDLGYLDALNTIWWDEITDHIRYQSPVIDINTEGKHVIVTTQDHLEYRAHKVIVTASVGVLQSETIRFVPTLPADTVDAYTHIGMGKGLKVALRFKSQFWDDKMAYLITDGLACSCWVPTAYKIDSPDHIIMCYPMGNSSEVLSNISQSAKVEAEANQLIITEVLADLDAVFSGAASNEYLSGIVQDWSSDPYVRGSYSYAMLDTYRSPYKNKRLQLSKPVRDMIYFAGEATSNTNPACVPGALQEGMRAANSIHTVLNGVSNPPV